ncbi:hypothetical protein DN752_17880 [Echinicola strongylocentroti]|uniref:Phage major capsid protein n=1 Tax=Echinicola strongylocentroti TaxID=1795355 RepID=A0A2Z4IMA0_9BACT|nr:hypothetical protein [Echinicola strongylocentroti]AWW31850.1 hypothetical protein DN752_17880 [Echinicola strongylocentroti]
MPVSPATDISAIKAYIHKWDKTLINQMLNGLDIMNDLTVIRNVREPRDLYKMTVDSGARPLNLNIEHAKGGRKWTKRTLTPQRGMKIIRMIPEELRETFMSEMLDINAKEVPFANWVWAQEFAKLASEINDNFYFSKYHGDNVDAFDAGAVYSEGDLVYFNEIIYRMIDVADTTAGQSPETDPAKWEDVDNKVILDGPHEKIEYAIANEGLLTVGDGGTFDETTAYDYFHSMWAVVPEAHKNKGMVAEVSMDVAQDLAINVNSKFGSGQGIANSDIEEGKEFILKNTGGRLRVRPKTWMSNSRRVIMTMKGNMVLGTNQTSDSNKVGKVVENLHGYDAIVKWMLGFEFRDLEVLYVNDQQ